MISGPLAKSYNELLLYSHGSCERRGAIGAPDVTIGAIDDPRRSAASEVGLSGHADAPIARL